MATATVVACSTCGAEIPRAVQYCGSCGAENFGGRPAHQQGAAPPAITYSPGAAVVVTDVQMPFGSMVFFMVKWALASIPAIIILAFIGFFLSAFVTGLLLAG